MEQVLENESRIPARITFLKPISSAIAIGTGGPFGAEGPHHRHGRRNSAQSSGKCSPLTSAEQDPSSPLAPAARHGRARLRQPRFRSPPCYRIAPLRIPRPLVSSPWPSPPPLPPVSASISDGAAPIFPMPAFAPRRACIARPLHAHIGIVIGILAVGVTRSVYWIEDMFEHIPLHWMWWPAIGGLVVGVIGYFSPHTMGVGYDNISQIISDQLPLRIIAFLTIMGKFLSWAISLSSGTSGGTLAPLPHHRRRQRRAASSAHSSSGSPRSAASISASPRWSAWRRCLPAHRARCSPA